MILLIASLFFYKSYRQSSLFVTTKFVEKIQTTIQIQYFHENDVCEAILLWRTNYCLTCKKLLLISQQLLWENDMILGQNTNSMSSGGTKSFFNFSSNVQTLLLSIIWHVFVIMRGYSHSCVYTSRRV